MKKALSTLLAVCLLISMATPTYAAEAITQNVVVSSYEELITAIDAAQDGDTIEVDSEIRLNNGDNIITDKGITIKRARRNYSADVFSILYSGEYVFEGVTFVSTDSRRMLTAWTSGVNLIIKDCRFTSGSYPVYFYNYQEDVSFMVIQDSIFSNTKEGAVYGAGNIDVTIINSTFLENVSTADQGAIRFDSGSLHLYTCSFVDNASLGNAAIFYCNPSENGVLDITNCQFTNSQVDSADHSAALDIYAYGCTLSLTDENIDETMCYYNTASGEKTKIHLPLVDCTDILKISYLPYDPTADNGDIEDNDSNQDIEPGGKTDNNEDEPKQDAEEDGGSGNPDNGDTEPQPDPPAEETPPSGEKDSSEEKDPSENTPSGEEDSPKEPEQPSDSDKLTPSQPPQESDNSNDHDNTPSKPYKPSHGASAPSTSTNPAPAQKLQCGEAVIDSTRSAKLSGYGDGQLHLEDSLTRAQMSKIIYGLLDENCIEKIGKSNDGFNDVPAEAWFHAAVSTLYNAGVVNGVGGGNYNPNDTVTWAQIIAVLSRFVDEEDCTLHNITYNGWAESAIKTAVALQWIEDRSSFDANAVISRGEFVELVNHVLSLYV